MWFYWSHISIHFHIFISWKNVAAVAHPTIENSIVVNLSTEAMLIVEDCNLTTPLQYNSVTRNPCAWLSSSHGLCVTLTSVATGRTRGTFFFFSFLFSCIICRMQQGSSTILRWRCGRCAEIYCRLNMTVPRFSVFIFRVLLDGRNNPPFIEIVCSLIYYFWDSHNSSEHHLHPPDNYNISLSSQEWTTAFAHSLYLSFFWRYSL